MKDINIEINVCDSTGKSTCTVHPHTCCHSDNCGDQEPGVSGVTSVFGRTGVVTAQSGDYTTDQVTETDTRKFATPDEKAVWNAKQAELISGTTIHTLFGQSLLGSGDLSLTPAQMGAAAVGHTHTTAEITDYTQKTKQLIHSSLEAGTGVTLSYNPASEKTVISATGGGSGSGGSGYVVADRQGATAGQNHAFSISPQNTFNLAAYALKEVAGATNQTYVVDDFNADSEKNYNVTNAVFFDGRLIPYLGEKYHLSAVDGGYSARIKSDGHSISISSYANYVVPEMTSNTLPAGCVASASSEYDSYTMAYKSFTRVGGTYANRQVWFSKAAGLPAWLMIELPSTRLVTEYEIGTRTDGGAVDKAQPTSFILQGSNDGMIWSDIDKRTSITWSSNGEKKTFTVTSPGNFSKYRLYITASNSLATVGQVGIAELNLMRDGKLLLTDGVNYYTALNGVLSNIPSPDFDRGFIKSGKIMASELAGMSQVAVFYDEPTDVSTIYTPYPQIITPRALTPLTSYSAINSATLTATQTGNGKVRVAVTRDLVNWHVLRNGIWVDVGALSADTVGATKLIADGMTPTELGGITAAQWTQLFASNNGVPDALAFAFALDITDPVADVATIDRLALNVNDASSWKVQSPAEVEIRWRTDSVTFRTATAGNYKLAYQVP
ncbi:discoidin domain-containing protein [Pectobacterium polonicum]|uniref:discoidin domain-containing protein n=1 Tax=Pectobacterium polonicum TaxID=2485124 RepID=UPI002B250808|nr:discoidin domain-containing protein [Pectobacterium polonicum]